MAKSILANSVVTTNKKDADLVYLGCLMIKTIEEMFAAESEKSELCIEKCKNTLKYLRERWINTFFEEKTTNYC